ncbi:FAD/NAD(P)-binding domain-containing protein [Xylariaceae sp. FL0255]|nr:FAD/NAD(P)-binding domain-containing protein [Xylariaceae sp. FL0255]
MSTTNPKNIVILGGSYAGLPTAHYLLKHALPILPDPKPYKVILISTSSQAKCRPAAPRALLSDAMFPQQKLFVDIKTSFKQYGDEKFAFEKGTVTNLDCEARTVTYLPAEAEVEGIFEVIPYHALIIATGASTPSPLLGYGSNDETTLRANWAAFRAALPNAKHIVVAGGGASGVEVAGELGEYLNGKPGWFSSTLKNSRVRITLLSGGKRLLPYFAQHPGVAATAEKYLARLGVNVVHGTRVVSVKPMGDGAGTTEVSVGGAVTLALDNGETLAADLYIPATGAQANTSFAPEGIKRTSNGDNRIEVDAATLRVTAPEAGGLVYAIGDVATAARPAVHNILAQVPVLCANVRRDLLLAAGVSSDKIKVGKGAREGEDRKFVEDVRETQFVPLGTSTGVGAVMGFRVPGFLVWLIKGRDYWLWTTGNLWNGKQWEKES